MTVWQKPIQKATASDLSMEEKISQRKKTVNIRYNLGFERMVRSAVLKFREMGLEPVIYRHATHIVNKRGNARIGFTGGVANPQYDYDHRQDQALFLDSDFVQRKLRSMQNAYENYKELSAVHGGPACIETFGEEPFAPETKTDAWVLSEAQQKLQVDLDNESYQIVNRYIKGDERSFTIIAYPIPEIERNSLRFLRKSLRSIRWITNYMKEFSRRSLRLWIPVSGWK